MDNNHVGYVVRVKELHPHPNADRLQIMHLFETDTVVDLNVHVGDMGVYFPTELQLSERFCEVNNLVRRKDENGNEVGGFLDPDKRNIKAIKLRGQKSDGLYLPITCLTDFCRISDLHEGDRIGVINGEEICRKYLPQQSGSISYKHKENNKKACKEVPYFYKHVETEQLAYNLDAFHPGDIVQITEKLDGTSGRTGNMQVAHEHRTIWDRLLHRHGKNKMVYEYVTGTRNVVLVSDHQGGFYESDDWRYAMSKKFENKLPENMEVFYEIVGFQGPNGCSIMPSVSNSRINDKNFIKTYGDTTTFSYGCKNENGYNDEYPCCQIYVYRIIIVTNNGDTIELSPAQIKYYCEQWGVNYVPEYETFIIPQDCTNPGEYVVKKAEQYFDGPSVLDASHIKEGVVLRICNRNNFKVFKHKNFNYKLLRVFAVEQLEKNNAIENMSQDIIEEL